MRPIVLSGFCLPTKSGFSSGGGFVLLFGPDLEFGCSFAAGPGRSVSFSGFFGFQPGLLCSRGAENVPFGLCGGGEFLNGGVCCWLGCWLKNLAGSGFATGACGRNIPVGDLLVAFRSPSTNNFRGVSAPGLFAPVWFKPVRCGL